MFPGLQLHLSGSTEGNRLSMSGQRLARIRDVGQRIKDVKLEIGIRERVVEDVEQAIERSLGVIVLDRINQEPKMDSVTLGRDPELTSNRLLTHPGREHFANLTSGRLS